MKTKIVLGFVLVFITMNLMAQNQTQGVSIAPDETPPSKDAMLDVVSSTKGVLVPRVAYSVIDPTGDPGGAAILHADNIHDTPGQDGLLVFVITSGANYGYWYFEDNVSGGEWKKLANGNGGDLWEKNTGDNNIHNTYLSDKVGIGTTSPSQRLTVSGGGISVVRNASSGIQIKITENNDVYGGHYNEINCDGSTLDLQFANGGGVRVGSSVAGSDLRVYGTVFYYGLSSFSDSTLKENIVPLRTALETGDYNDYNNVLSKIKLVDLYEYNFKLDTARNLNYGVLAQELATVFPSLVINDTYSVDKGSGPASVSKLAVNYQGLTMVLLEGVKELTLIKEDQQNTIDSLNIRVSKLEEDYQDLLSRVEALETP